MTTLTKKQARAIRDAVKALLPMNESVQLVLFDAGIVIKAWRVPMFTIRMSCSDGENTYRKQWLSLEDFCIEHGIK